MPAILSKIQNQHVLALASSGVALVSYISYIRMLRCDQKQEDRAAAAAFGKDKSANGRRGAAASRSHRVQVDARFFAQMARILRVLVPRFVCPETGYLLLVALSLLCRTYADVWMIQNGTAIESAIISRSTAAFLIPFFKYVFAMPTISVINNILKYGLNELRLRFRSRLVKHLYKEYMSGFTFYKMTNLDSRIANPDQILTQDVEKFCDSIVELYSNISKPILDMFLYVHRLTNTIGFQGPASLLVYLFVSGIFLTRLRRPLGKMTVIEQQHEGEFRHINSRVITNSEEIAFYQGNDWERGVLMNTFDNLMAHLRKLVLFRFSMGFVDNIVAKYMATVVGYLVVSRAFLRPDNTRLDSLGNTGLIEEYYKNGRMLVRLAEAVGRLALAGRELTRLAGFTARVTELMDVLKDLNKGHYVRTMLTEGGASRRVGSKTVTPSASIGKDLSAAQVEIFGNSLALPEPSRMLIPGSGEIIVQDRIIRFDDVPLVTPNGDVLIDSLSFEVKSGTNVLVCGPNGCGKSSLFRILGELWPLFGGRMTKPAKGKLFYIPQRPYMATGSLRDQIIYPDSIADMRQKGVKDADLEHLLELIQLSYILDREGGWESVQDWMDVLSGGEKQRVAMARLFYHAPQFAILDECTSAVSVDVEHVLYSYCREVGITLFTVSHRKSLWKHHDYYLHMDGRGEYEFKPIDESTLEFGS